MYYNYIHPCCYYRPSGVHKYRKEEEEKGNVEKWFLDGVAGASEQAKQAMY
jgi:hypothetical protein